MAFATFRGVIGAAAVLLALAAPRPSAAEDSVDLRLVLAADVSRSVDDREFRLQREGYAAALLDPRVLSAIRSGPLRRIAVCFVEWSGASSQNLLIDWTVIGDDEAAGYFSDRLRKEPRSFADRTAIGAGIDMAVAQFDRSGANSERRIIDVSGDGTNNSGRPVTQARDDAVNAGITINGLVILSTEPMPWNPEHTHPPGGLAKYYEENVIGGPGAFLLVVEGFETFAEAMTSKLVREIAQANASSHSASSGGGAQAP